jgi:multiple sugar transport system permease protein
MFKKFKDKQEGVIRSFDMGSPGVKLAAAVIFLICVVMVIVAIFPSVWVFLASFKDIKEFRRNPTIFPSTFDIGKFIKTWHDLDFFQYYINSMISVTGSVICAIFFNGLLAYGLGILKPKGHKVVFAMVMWSLLIPATTSLVALFVNINRIGLNGSFVPLWLAMGANAFYVVLFKQFFEQLPKSLIEAATLDGCGNLQTFTKVVLPLSRPIIMVVAIFALNAAWSDFLLPFLLLANTPKETVMVRLFAFRTSNATDVEVLRAIAFSILPPIVLFAVFQKQIMQNVVSAGIKG